VTGPLDVLLAETSLEATLFPPTSRYHGVATATLERADGTPIPYLRRRFVPPPERFALLHEYVVREGDRLDRIAAASFGDAEQFWRLCDANGAIRPDELIETVGRRLRVTLSDGVPGDTNA
jgi:hypothetical protein